MGTPRAADLTGLRYGRLTATSIAFAKDGNAYWTCVCDCGVECVVAAPNLKRGATASCGCLRRDLSSTRNRTHGGHASRPNVIWRGMRQRCRDAHLGHFHLYGGRGISVCPEWADFETFRDWAVANGYAPGLTIERRNNDGNYEPGNCLWIPRPLQAKNRRTNRFIETPRGRMILRDAAMAYGINHLTLRDRLDSGWEVQRALTEPPHRVGERARRPSLIS